MMSVNPQMDKYLRLLFARLRFLFYYKKRYGVKVVVGTHPIPKKYLDMHTDLGTWADSAWKPLVTPSISIERSSGEIINRS